jgi:hypothetical protein
MKEDAPPDCVPGRTVSDSRAKAEGTVMTK